MIFISGVHGVGKSYFCNLVKSATGIECFSCSTLIEQRKNHRFTADKYVANIDENQLYLLPAVDDLKARLGEFLLDGHFCLLNAEGSIERIPINTFKALNPDVIILLTADPKIIAERRQERDGAIIKVTDIKAFQDEELRYAKEVSKCLKIPLYIATSNNDIERIIKIIRSGRIYTNGRKV